MSTFASSAAFLTQASLISNHIGVAESGIFPRFRQCGG
jgi:hypothetical protein